LAHEGAVSLDAAWQTLAGERAADLEWFRDNVLFGHGVPCPVLEEVEVVEGASGWRMRVRLANRGDAATVVPVQLLGSAGAGVRRVALAAGETVTLDEVFDVPPGQVVVDPEGLVVRRQVNSGLHWSRWGGIQ